MEGGDKALTTAGLARAANCSKESLYKWFGDRDGLPVGDDLLPGEQGAHLRASRRTVDGGEPHRASGGVCPRPPGRAGVETCRWRSTGWRSARPIATARARHALAERGRRQIDRRARAPSTPGQRDGLLRFADGEEAYRTLYGLIVSDMHVRMLGDMPQTKGFAARAEKAVSAFLALYGTEKVLAGRDGATRSGQPVMTVTTTDKHREGTKHARLLRS